MRKRTYIKNINCPMTIEMFNRIKEITDSEEITFSDFIRSTINDRFLRLDNADTRTETEDTTM